MPIKDALQALLEGNSLSDALTDLLEADAGLQRLRRGLKASDWSDEDLARRLYSEAKRKGSSIEVRIGSRQHFIIEWHRDGQITTQTMSMDLLGPSFKSSFSYHKHNHSNWADLASNAGFRVAIL